MKSRLLYSRLKGVPARIISENEYRSKFWEMKITDVLLIIMTFILIFFAIKLDDVVSTKNVQLRELQRLDSLAIQNGISIKYMARADTAWERQLEAQTRIYKDMDLQLKYLAATAYRTARDSITKFYNDSIAVINTTNELDAMGYNIRLYDVKITYKQLQDTVNIFIDRIDGLLLNNKYLENHPIQYQIWAEYRDFMLYTRQQLVYGAGITQGQVANFVSAYRAWNIARLTLNSPQTPSQFKEQLNNIR